MHLIVLIVLMTFTVVSAQTDEKAIETAFETLRSALNAGDADAFISQTTDDVMLLNMSGTGNPSIGKATVRATVTSLVTNLNIVWDSHQTHDIAIVGDLAFHRYSASMTTTPKKGGNTSRTRRRYTDILRRDEAGRWRLWQHIFVNEP